MSTMSDMALLKRKREDGKGVVPRHLYTKPGERGRTPRPCQRKSEPLNSECPGITEYIRRRECGAKLGKQSCRETADAFATRQPYAIKEYEGPKGTLSQFDKCFAAAWLDNDRVLFGTKDNKLAVLDTSASSGAAGTCRVIKLPTRLAEASPAWRPLVIETPPASFAAEAGAGARVGTEVDPWNALVRRHIAGRRHVRLQGTVEQLIEEPAVENCGIHAIAINPSGTRMVTGGDDPSDCAVFSVPELCPTALLTGHKDWVFGLDWITDNIVASGSRDKTVKLWCVPDAPMDDAQTTGAAKRSYRQLSLPLSTLDAHGDRVRDLRYCRDVRRLASMSTDGRIFFTDPETATTVEQKRLRGKKEMVCLATDGKLLVAGSQRHVSIMDHRVGTVIRDELLPGNNCDGVRSISFSGGGRLLTCGGGGGRITFYDVRAGQFLPAARMNGDERFDDSFHVKERGDGRGGGGGDDDDDDKEEEEEEEEEEEGEGENGSASDEDNRHPAYEGVINRVSTSLPRSRRRDESRLRGGGGFKDALSMQMGEGFLDRQHHVYLDHFASGNVLNACYAHDWDATGTRLMVAGGPLAYGLRGCYVGVWR